MQKNATRPSLPSALASFYDNNFIMLDKFYLFNRSILTLISKGYLEAVGFLKIYSVACSKRWIALQAKRPSLNSHQAALFVLLTQSGQPTLDLSPYPARAGRCSASVIAPHAIQGGQGKTRNTPRRLHKPAGATLTGCAFPCGTQ